MRMLTVQNNQSLARYRWRPWRWTHGNSSEFDESLWGSMCPVMGKTGREARAQAVEIRRHGLAKWSAFRAIDAAADAAE